MGIVKRQAAWNTIFNYAGQVIGYLNVAILFPLFLSPAEFGLTRLITSYSVLFAQFSSFGVKKVAVKFFPYFMDKNSGKTGAFLSILMLFPIVLLVLFFSVFFLFQQEITSVISEEELFKNYAFLIPFAAIFTLYYWIFEAFLKGMFETTFTTFLQSVVLKLFWTSITFMYAYDYISFDQFVLGYFCGYLFLWVISLVYLLKLNAFTISFRGISLLRKRIKKMVSFGMYAVLNDTSSLLVNHIDKVMLGAILNLESVAVYSLASYLCTVMVIPSQSLSKVLSPMIARYWKNKNRQGIIDAYSQSSVIGIMASGLVAILIWGNIHEIFRVLPDGYEDGLYVVLFIMLSYIIDISFGMNSDIIQNSKHFRFNSLASGVLIILMIAFNAIFIGLYGITGAALATLMAKIFYNLLKFGFLFFKERLQPFSFANLKALLSLGVAYIIMILIPSFELFTNEILSDLSVIALRVVTGAGVAVVLYYALGVSNDVNKSIRHNLKRIGVYL